MSDSVSREPAAGPGASQKSLSDLNVLIIDDSAFSVSLMETALGEIGVRNVSSASDVATAHAKIRQAPHLVDCLICDQVMPQATGLEFLSVIRLGRLKDVRPGIAFILCTGESDPEIERAARQLDVTAFIRKPPAAELLRDALHRAARFAVALDPGKYSAVHLPERRE
jgi:CheY-like chemotaxis protein